MMYFWFDHLYKCFTWSFDLLDEYQLVYLVDQSADELGLEDVT